MTEEEANTKWCPMIRFHGGGNYTVDDQNGRCIGSACMMWRPITETVADSNGGIYIQSFHGYCGLAGEP